MKVASPKLETSNLTANEEALLRCQSALELRDKGDYDGALRAMNPFWNGMGERPDTKGLHAPVAAEVLLCAGILTGWIGSKNEIADAQEVAKNLITESMTFYESTGDSQKIAAARVELAYCYWQQGALDEARVIFNEALRKLTTEGNTRAWGLLRLAILEWSASRYDDALEILTGNASLFERITSHAIKGAYHNQLALAFRHRASSENRNDYLQQAIREYQEADYYLRLAQNNVFLAHVKNNVGFLLYKLSRFKEAHAYLEDARRLTVSVRDKVRTAQIDDTRAQVLIAQKRLKEAELVARGAVSVLEKSGQQCLLSEALVTHGIALARLQRTERAEFTFQKAIGVAHQVGALNKAGLAALTLIEELDELSAETLRAAFEQAGDWLSESRSLEILRRVNAAARKVLSSIYGETTAAEATEILLNKLGLQEQVLNYERALIRQALAKANGSVTHAAGLLGMTHQALTYAIGARHEDLLKERSPIRRRARRDSA